MHFIFEAYTCIVFKFRLSITHNRYAKLYEKANFLVFFVQLCQTKSLSATLYLAVICAYYLTFFGFGNVCEFLKNWLNFRDFVEPTDEAKLCTYQ